jgi:hypothetical protein
VKQSRHLDFIFFLVTKYVSIFGKFASLCSFHAYINLSIGEARYGWQVGEG